MRCDLQAKFNGTGRWEWEGNVYEGGFRDGYFHGNGTFLWSTGECFCGEFDTDCPKSGMLQQPQWGAQSYKASYDGATPLFASSKPHSLIPFDQLTPMSSGPVTCPLFHNTSFVYASNALRVTSIALCTVQMAPRRRLPTTRSSFGVPLHGPPTQQSQPHEG